MREILFRAKGDTRYNDGDWYYGVPIQCYDGDWQICTDSYKSTVIEDTIGQYTGMTEFVVVDKSINGKLFEGDIVEVWSRRRPIYEDICLYRDKTTSQYDLKCKARAVIKWNDYYGYWKLDYDNAYNHNMEKLKGSESSERTVEANHQLYFFGYHCPEKEDWHRKHNTRYKWGDIVKIGNIYDNPELLEASE